MRLTSSSPFADEGLSVDIVVARPGFQVAATFDAAPGETIALLGPNGSGKSTLVSAIAGLGDRPSGRIAIGGTTLDDDALPARVPPERRPIGVVFQDLLLFPHLSALENVAFALRARGVDRRTARARAVASLERLGILGRASARPRELSGGEAQRVALARALIADPTLLLLDEPLSALDVGTRASVRDLVRAELARSPGIRILVSHDPVEASMLADRLVLLEEGRVTQIGTPQEVREAPRSRYAADLVGVNAFRGRLERTPEGTRVVLADGGEIVAPPTDDLHRDEVIAILRPSDVTLSLQPPAGSARNALRGPVSSLADDGERVRVRVASVPPVVAEVTSGSLERLGLRPGLEVWASFKAVEVQILEP